MPPTWIPGVLGTWARYIAANFPAPINPTTSGRPCAARSRNFAYRFMCSSLTRIAHKEVAAAVIGSLRAWTSLRKTQLATQVDAGLKARRYHRVLVWSRIATARFRAPACHATAIIPTLRRLGCDA